MVWNHREVDPHQARNACEVRLKSCVTRLTGRPCYYECDALICCLDKSGATSCGPGEWEVEKDLSVDDNLDNIIGPGRPAKNAGRPASLSMALGPA